MYITDCPAQRLTMKKLDSKSTNIIVYSHASYKRKKDECSQLGYTILLTYNTGTVYVVDYSNIKLGRLVQSVLGAETFGLADAYDVVILHHGDKMILRRTLTITLLTESATLYNLLITNSPTIQKD